MASGLTPEQQRRLDNAIVATFWGGDRYARATARDDYITPVGLDADAARIVANTIGAAREAGDHGFGEGPEGQRRFDLWLSILTRDWPTTIRCLNAGRG